MKIRLIWAACAAPWVIAALFLVLCSVDAYQDGIRFRPGLHGLKWFIRLGQGVFAYLPAIILAVGALVLGRRELKQTRSLPIAILIVVTSILIPLTAVPVMSSCFFKGRDRGYRALDYKAIHAACLSLTARVMDTERPLSYIKWDDGIQPRVELPDEILRLQPLQVHATKSAAVVQLDGGGPMYHEGIGVIAEGASTLPSSLAKYCKRLDKTIPVYRYRLYDCRIFLDEVESMSTSEQSSSVRSD